MGFSLSLPRAGKALEFVLRRLLVESSGIPIWDRFRQQTLGCPDA